jgi:hypothetical protein
MYKSKVELWNKLEAMFALLVFVDSNHKPLMTSPQNRNGNRRIVRVDSLDELRGLGKVCVPREFHAKERMSLVTREVHILYPL